MLVVALVGVAVNLAATVVLHGADRRSLNVEGAFQHVFTDLVAFIATAVAGLVILLTGFDRADGIASLFVAAVMLRASWGLLRESGRIFLEAAPRGVDVDAIGQPMIAVDLAAGLAKTTGEIIQIDRCVHERDIETKSTREATRNDSKRKQSRAERVGPGGNFRCTLAPEDA